MFLVQNFAQLVWGGDLRGYDYLTEPVSLAARSSPATSCCCSGWRWCSALALIVVLRARCWARACAR
jgi:branched-chain amino acid transport system permease protein